MAAEFRRVDLPREREQLIAFLCREEWPFHGRRRLTPDDVTAMEFDGDDVASYWISEHDEPVGLIRLLDLGDIGEGAPLFDVRITAAQRGRGLGTTATRWIADHLFGNHAALHRIEAHTRHDNSAMQRVLSLAGFTHEGRLRDAWSSDGEWFDTMVYGILRSDWTSQGEARVAPGPS